MPAKIFLSEGLQDSITCYIFKGIYDTHGRLKLTGSSGNSSRAFIHSRVRSQALQPGQDLLISS